MHCPADIGNCTNSVLHKYLSFLSSTWRMITNCHYLFAPLWFRRAPLPSFAVLDLDICKDHRPFCGVSHWAMVRCSLMSVKMLWILEVTAKAMCPPQYAVSEGTFCPSALILVTAIRANTFYCVVNTVERVSLLDTRSGYWTPKMAFGKSVICKRRSPSPCPWVMWIQLLASRGRHGNW